MGYTTDEFIAAYEGKIPTEQLTLLKAVAAYFESYDPFSSEARKKIENDINEKYKNATEGERQGALEKASNSRSPSN